MLLFSSGHAVPPAKYMTCPKRLRRAKGGYHSIDTQLAVYLKGECGLEQISARRA